MAAAVLRATGSNKTALNLGGLHSLSHQKPVFVRRDADDALLKRETRSSVSCRRLLLLDERHKLLGEALAAERPKPRAGAAAEYDGGNDARINS